MSQDKIQIKLDKGLVEILHKGLVGIKNGIAPLDENGKIPLNYIPSVPIVNFYTVPNKSDLSSISDTKIGDQAIVMSEGEVYVLTNTPSSTLSNWIKVSSSIKYSNDKDLQAKIQSLEGRIARLESLLEKSIKK